MKTNEMIDVLDETELTRRDGGSWCSVFWIGSGALLGTLVEPGAGTIAGGLAGAAGADAFCS
jgi:hypothetical protein